MSLLVRINLALITVFAVGAGVTGLICRAVLQANAEREIRTEAGLMMDSALAVGDYTAKQIAGPESLIVLLGAEIESEPERRRFLESCRQLLRLSE